MMLILWSNGFSLLDLSCSFSGNENEDSLEPSSTMAEGKV